MGNDCFQHLKYGKKHCRFSESIDGVEFSTTSKQKKRMRMKKLSGSNAKKGISQMNVMRT